MLQILYQDEHLLAVHKPAKLLVHRSPISRDETFLLQRLRDQIGQWVYPVHRLDRATSGLILFGLSAEAARRLVGAFEQRQVDKAYLALCRGWLDEQGEIDHPVRDEEGNNQPQPALTRYRCLQRVELAVAVDRYPSSRYSLALISPETGRRQQIRKHFKHISHHLIGDSSHGNGRHNRFFQQQWGIDRLMLTSWQLGFEHPFSGERLQLQAPWEEEWLRLFQAFGWPSPESNSRATR
ncbi:MAG: pseudouridylate synthase [Gammaproteobacteria bacterium]|nr:pseudouridylate synthase [Gammaproteobacteria bacterium]